MHTFYNPKKSALAISISYQRKTGVLEFARSLNPYHKGPIQKGQQIFDWQNKLTFTISPEEAPKIIKFIRQPHKDSISFTHAPTGNTSEKFSSLLIAGKRPYINLSLTTQVRGQQKKQITFTLRENETIDEISIFMQFLHKIIEAPFIEDYINFAIQKSHQSRG